MLKIKPKSTTTRHLSGTLIAEQDTHGLWKTVWTLITLILIIALDIQFLWIQSFKMPISKHENKEKKLSRETDYPRLRNSMF